MGYTDYSGKIKQSRDAGYSDQEILDFLQKNDPSTAPKIKQSLDAGYSNSDIVNFLGSQSGDSQPQQPEKSGIEKVAGFLGMENLGKGISQAGANLIHGGQVEQQQKTAEQSNNAIQEQINKIRASSPTLTPENRAKITKLLALKNNPYKDNNLEDIATNGEGYVSNGAVIGSAVNTGLNVLSGGSLSAEGALGKVAAPVAESKLATFLAGKSPNVVARIAGRGIQSAGVGAVSQVAQDVQDGKVTDFASGLASAGKGAESGAAFGAGLATAGALKNAGGTLVRSALGKTTGAGSEAIREAVTNPSKDLISAMRGKVSSENILSDARDAVANIAQNQQTEYKASRQGLKMAETPVNIDSVKSKLSDVLKNFRVSVDENGGVAFDRLSPIKDKGEQNVIKDIVETLHSSKDLSADDVDALKQVVDNYYSPSLSNRSKLVLSSIGTGLRQSLKDSVPGYDKLTSKYAESASLLNDIEQALSLGNRKPKDTAIRKLSSALKDNQPFRQKMIEVLDSKTGSSLKSELAGAALNPTLPGGLQTFLDQAGVGAAVLHPGTAPMLAAGLATTSPRLMGEGAVKYGQVNKIAGKIVPKGIRETLRKQALMRASALVNK